MQFIKYIFIVLLLIPCTSFAQNNIVDLEEIEKYLNSIKTIESNFTLTDTNGNKTTGKFMLHRPGKMRFEYDAPIKDFIVADGTRIYFYDSEMKQPSSMPLDNSLANLFLREEINLSKDIEVSKIYNDKNLIKMTLQNKKEPLYGSLTLFLGKNPLELTRWKVTDSQNLSTFIELNNVKFNTKIDENIFYYRDPEREKLFLNR